MFEPCRLKPLGQFSKIQLVREFPGSLASTTNVVKGLWSVPIFWEISARFCTYFGLNVYLPSASTFLRGFVPVPQLDKLTAHASKLSVQHSMLSELWWMRNTIAIAHINRTYNNIYVCSCYCIFIFTIGSPLPLFISLIMANNDWSWAFCISSFGPSSYCFVLSGWIGNFWLRHC